MDQAHRQTDRIIKKTEKEVSKVYAEAAKDVKAKLDDYMRRFELKDKTWRGWVKSGYKTEAQYKEWLQGQIAIGRRWEQMRDNLAQDLHNANEIARSIVNGHSPEVYALNHDYSVYEIEHGLGVDTAYTMYDRQTVERLFSDDLVIPLNGAKDIAWQNKQVQSAMLQGILQGEGIPDIASRIAVVTAESNRKAAIRNARTIYTGVQNAGRVDGYKRAQNMGIELEQQWVATLDSRTRHWHRELDGQTAPVGGYFENEFGKIRYPGDPQADPANICNCRCTLIAALKGFARDMSDLSIRNTKHFENESYEEWKNEKESKTNPIDLPEKLSEKERLYYLNEYKYGGV